MKELNLILHCGAATAERAEVFAAPTPASTRSWSPIPHSLLIEGVEDTLKSNGLRIVNQAHGLTKAGDRYFGLMQVANGSNHDDYGWVLGLRNSHDKRFPAGFVAGAGVFVCDNLSFSGEVKFMRKHTLNIIRDLPGLVQRGVGRLMERWHHQDTRLDAYKNSKLQAAEAHDLVIRALDVQACTITQVPNILAEYRNPRHQEFSEPTVWSLFNSFTEVQKGSGLNELPKRTERLHGLLDTHVGMPAFGNN